MFLTVSIFLKRNLSGFVDVLYVLCFIIFLGSDFPIFFIFQEEEVTAEFLAGKVPEIVYKKAIEAVPGNVCCANKCKPQCLYTIH